MLGILTLPGVWFVGDSRHSADARRAAQPSLQNRFTTYEIVVGAVLVLTLVAPVVARGWPMLLVLIALVIAAWKRAEAFVQREAQQPG
jgi:hypothetical protein